jgi:phosphorylase kinase alpha/beta subunit
MSPLPGTAATPQAESLSSAAQASDPSLKLLQAIDAQIEAVVLQRQHPISGLLPASTAHTVHGNYGDAWVRDCVYSIQCVWGLALAHRRQQGASRRAYELEQRVLQLMRGLLNAMLRQAHKVERFKHSLERLDAIHAKFDTGTGEPVVPDDGWGHLQLDATALYLLQLAQLTRSGLVVIQSSHERDFIQNLVYYVARAYRVPDYGIWERGDKGNHGLPERNASSIGLVKAALEALEGLDLYGPHGDGSATLVIPHDAIVRLRRALRGLLPRESASKEVDAACLAVIGYPAWAVEDPKLVERTRSKIRQELGGPYGYKRFKRDGHQTVVEDHTRLHYEREELAQFEHIECEWPLFWAYELITACCEERWAEARQWRQRLAGVSVLVDGNALLPELYRVPEAALEAERRQPGSQPREANENVPLLWTQSLTWLADLLLAGLISPEDLDPSGRRQTASLGASEVLVALVPATAEIATALEAAGLPVAGDAVTVSSSSDLARRMGRVGANGHLGLSGHPPVRMETMATARLYRSADGRAAMAFLPAVLEESTFYLADDAEQLVDTVGSELRLLQRHWRGAGSPLLLIPVAEGAFCSDRDAFVRLGHALRGGLIDGVPVQLAPLNELIGQACWQTLPEAASGTLPASEAIVASPLLASLESQPLTAQEEQELEDSSIGDLLERLWQSTSLPEQAEVLEQLSLRLGLAAQLQGPQQQTLSLKELLNEVYLRALEQGQWGVVRRTAAALDLVHPQLEDALTDLLLRQKQVVVGRNYTRDSLITEPQGSRALAAMIRRFSGEDGREWMLQQELLLALELASERELSPIDAFEALCNLPPHALRRQLRAVLADLEHAREALQRKEQLHLSGRVRWEASEPLDEHPQGGCWLQHRSRLGALGRVPRDFYPGIWELLHHCRGIVIGDKLDKRNRLASKPLLSEKTPGERNFASQVDHLLSKIEAPEYRQLCCETLLTLIAFVAANPKVYLDDDLALDVVVGHAVRVGWQLQHPDIAAADYGSHKAEAWDNFYRSSPADCRHWQLEALRQLTEG